MYLNALKPFELRHIGKPFLIGFCGVKSTVQKVFGNILRILGPSGTAMVIVFDSGMYTSGPADTPIPSCHSHGYHGHDADHH